MIDCLELAAFFGARLAASFGALPPHTTTNRVFYASYFLSYMSSSSLTARALISTCGARGMVTDGAGGAATERTLRGTDAARADWLTLVAR